MAETGVASSRRGGAAQTSALRWRRRPPAWSTHALKGRWWAESSGPDQGGARAPSDRRSVGGQAGSSSNLQWSARTRLSSWLRRDGARGGMAVGSFRSAKQHPEGGSRIFRTTAGSERKARTTMGAAQRAQARASTNRTLRRSCAQGKRRGRRVWAGKAPSWAERLAGANCDVSSVGWLRCGCRGRRRREPGAKSGAVGEYSVVPNEVEVRSRQQGREAAQEGQGRQVQLGVALGRRPGFWQAIAHAAARAPGEAVDGEGSS